MGALASSLLLAQTPAAQAADLAEIRARGSVRIGVSMFAPWTVRNEAGELDGFEIAVGRRVADAIGVEPDFRVYVWDEIIGGIERDEIDMIAAGMAITPIRAARVDFSDPYSESGFTIVANAGMVAEAVDDVRALDIEAYHVAIVDETLSGQAAPLFFDQATIDEYTEAQDAEAAVLAGNVPLYLTSVPEATILVAEYPAQLTLPLAEPLPGPGAGFAVQRGNETLLDFLNAWIRGGQQRAWLESTYGIWFAP
jgi:polar amino acid transport system substrate-binding protein